jgi:hypothetical protein
VEAHRDVRRRGFHIFQVIGSQMAVRLSAIGAGRSLPLGRFQVLISVRGLVETKALVRLEGLGQLKNAVASLGIEPVTFRLVAQCLSQLCYRMAKIYCR